MKQSFTKPRKGAGLVEYGLLSGLIAVVAIAAVAGLGRRIEETFETITSAVSSDPLAAKRDTAALEVDPELVGVGALNQIILADDQPTASLSYDSGTQDGDLVVAIVMHHHPLNVPAGWAVESANSTSWYTLTVLSKTYSASDGASITLSQSGSNHQLGGQIFTLRGDGVEVAEVSNSPMSTGLYPTVPDFHAIEAGAFMIAAMVETYTPVSGTNTINLVDANWTQTSPLTIRKNRLGIGYETAGSDNQLYSGVSFTNSTHYSSREWATTVVQIDAPKLLPEPAE